MKKMFVREVVGEELSTAYRWAYELKKSLELVKGSLRDM